MNVVTDLRTTSLRPVTAAPPQRPRVVVIGAGFAGLTATQQLAGVPVDVTVVDKRNYHLFQPLLYQVATAGLSPADIATPIRGIVHRQRNVTVLLARVIGIDREHREVLTEDQRLPYDYLIVATGARHAYFGHDEWEPYAPGLKKIDDATEIRNRVLVAFERAETTTATAERQALLTFAIIGGGPTGVELAGAIAELGRIALARDFRNIDPRHTRTVLIEAGPRLLPAFPESLSAATRRALEKLGVEVRLSQAVTGCDAEGVAIGNERLPARTIIWAAGVAASPAAKWLEAEKDRVGRVKVTADLSLPGHPEIFVIGDTALAVDDAGKPLPGLAPVAKQQGRYVARLIARELSGGDRPAPFRYRHLGNLATIGRKAAVADFGWLRLHGRLAWLVWGLVHIAFLIGFRNRVAVLWDWTWAYLTSQRGARLITGSER